MEVLTNENVKTLITKFTRYYYTNEKVAMLFLAPLVKAKLSGTLSSNQANVFLTMCKEKMVSLVEKGILTAWTVDVYTTKIRKSGLLTRHKTFKEMRDEELLLAVHGVSL